MEALSLNGTALIQLASFFVLWLGMKRLIWDPMLSALEEREARTAGARTEALRFQKDAGNQEAEYDSRLQKVRAELAAHQQAQRTGIDEQERSLLTEARTEAGNRLAEVRARLAKQATEERKALGEQAGRLAGDMVRAVAGRAL